MQAIPDNKTPNILPPIALLKAPPPNKPTTPQITMIMLDTTVLNLFITYPSIYSDFLMYNPSAVAIADIIANISSVAL